MAADKEKGRLKTCFVENVTYLFSETSFIPVYTLSSQQTFRLNPRQNIGFYGFGRTGVVDF